VPTEYDYHYIVSEHIDKLLYFLYLSKQLTDSNPVDLVLVKIVQFCLTRTSSSSPLTPSRKSRRPRRTSSDSKAYRTPKKYPALSQSYKPKIKFELFTDLFSRYMRESSAEIYNYYKVDPNASEIHKNDFLMQELDPFSVLYSSKMGRVVLVQNRRSKRRYVMKYIYRWKLVKFTEDERLLKILYTVSRFVCDTHQKNQEGFAKYYCVQECSTFVIFMMDFYQCAPLT
jgi:hypothetical protein